MEREQALEEVRLIKNLLEDTGKQIGKSGWAFIWLGLIMIGQNVIFLSLAAILNRGVFNQVPSWVMTAVIYAITIVVPAAVIFLSVLIYRKQVIKQESVALEKQIWQVWLWMIVGSIAVQFGDVIMGLMSFYLHNQAGGVTYIDYSLLTTLPLIITGVLTKRKFFYGAAIFTLILCLVPHYLFPGWKQDLERQICDAFTSACPFLITGIYFIFETKKQGIKTSTPVAKEVDLSKGET